MSFILHIVTLGVTGVTLFNLKLQWEAYQSYRALIRNNIDRERQIYCLEGKLLGPVSSSDESNQLLIEKTEVCKDTWHDSSKIRASEIMGWIRNPPNPYLKLADHLALTTHPANPIRIGTSGRAAMDMNLVKESHVCSSQPIIHHIPSSVDICKWSGQNLHPEIQIPVLNTVSNYKVTINKLHNHDPVYAVLHNNRKVIAIGARRQVKSFIAKQVYKFCPRKCGLLIGLQLATFAMISRKH